MSTRKLVETDAEQALLEELIESVKPPDVTAGRMHYLLFTPFRYPPLGHGSRFGGRFERGIWYGSETERGALAEVAYYRLLFLEGTRADLALLTVLLTSFVIRVRTANGIDLVAPPFASYCSVISSPASYAASQALGSAMREAGVEAFRYGSARDVQGGTNVGVFSPRAFGRNRPKRFETWHCVATRERVEVRKLDWFERVTHTFPRSDFLVSGQLPAPAL
ncbi:MAG: RES family NAD+ phosphorylase [Longimicrobiales bacterium]